MLTFKVAVIKPLPLDPDVPANVNSFLSTVLQKSSRQTTGHTPFNNSSSEDFPVRHRSRVTDDLLIASDKETRLRSCLVRSQGCF